MAIECRPVPLRDAAAAVRSTVGALGRGSTAEVADVSGPLAVALRSLLQAERQLTTSTCQALERHARDAERLADDVEAADRRSAMR